jgi:hypothetical protein
MKYDWVKIGDAMFRIGTFGFCATNVTAVALTPSWVGACMLASLLVTGLGLYIWGKD